MNDPPPVGVVGRLTTLLGVMAEPLEISELPLAAVRGETVPVPPLPTLLGIEEIKGDPDRGGRGEGCGFTACVDDVA
jgi:hypothetical protein